MVVFDAIPQSEPSDLTLAECQAWHSGKQRTGKHIHDGGAEERWGHKYPFAWKSKCAASKYKACNHNVDYTQTLATSNGEQAYHLFKPLMTWIR